MTWDERFLELFDSSLQKYQAGNQDFETYYSPEDLEFLASIGYQPREFFDFVEDYGDGGVPSKSTALLVAAVRRDFFLVAQNGQPSQGEVLTPDQLPSFNEEFEGIAYLPRILAKARGKLRGELDPDIMFSCGGDRKFLSSHGHIHPADFLRHVWAAGDDDHQVAEFVKRQQS